MRKLHFNILRSDTEAKKTLPILFLKIRYPLNIHTLIWKWVLLHLGFLCNSNCLLCLHSPSLTHKVWGALLPFRFTEIWNKSRLLLIWGILGSFCSPSTLACFKRNFLVHPNLCSASNLNLASALPCFNSVLLHFISRVPRAIKVCHSSIWQL